MKFISFNHADYAYEERFVVELTGVELQKIAMQEIYSIMKSRLTGIGEEFDLAPVFKENELRAQKSNHLERISSALQECHKLCENSYEIAVREGRERMIAECIENTSMMHGQIKMLQRKLDFMEGQDQSNTGAII